MCARFATRVIESLLVSTCRVNSRRVRVDHWTSFTARSPAIRDYSRTCRRDSRRASFLNGAVRPHRTPRSGQPVGRLVGANDSRLLRASRRLRHTRIINIVIQIWIYFADVWYLNTVRCLPSPARIGILSRFAALSGRIPFVPSRSRACLINRKKHFGCRLASVRFPKYPWLDSERVLFDEIREFLCDVYQAPRVHPFAHRILSTNFWKADFPVLFFRNFSI